MFGGVGGGGGGGYMMPAGGLWIQTFLDKTAFSEASRNIMRLGTEMKIIGRDFMIAGGLMGAPFIAAAKSASHAAVVQRAFNAVFRDGVKDADMFVGNLARTTGRFKTDIQESMMSISALFRGMNFGDKSVGLAKFTQSLMTDLAAFRGLSDQDVMQRFVSTLSGSVEAMDQLGIDVHEHAIQQELLAMGINKTVQEAREQDKIMARLNVIYKAMSQQGALGAAAEAMGHFDGQLTQLNTSIKEFQEALGLGVKPLLEGVIPLFNTFAGMMGTMAREAPVLTQMFAAMAGGAAAAGGLLWLGGAFMRATQALSAFMGPGGVFATLLAGGAMGVFANMAQDVDDVTEATERLTAAQILLQRRQEQVAAMPLGPARDQAQALLDDIAELQEKADEIRPTEEVGDLAAAGHRFFDFPAIEAQYNQLLDDISGKMTELRHIIGGQLADAAAEGGDELEDEIADGIREGFLKGIQGTYSAMAHRMFANQLSDIASGTGEGFAESLRSRQIRDRNRQSVADRRQQNRDREAQLRGTAGGSDRVGASLDAQEQDALYRRDTADRALMDPNLSAAERSRLMRMSQNASSDLDRIAAIKRQRASGGTTESASGGGSGYHQYGAGESILSPAPGQSRYRYEDSGAYLVDEEGRELHYWEGGDDPDIPSHLRQGGGSGGEGEGEGGPYYHYEGTPQGATEFPTGLTPADMPAAGGFGGTGAPRDPWAGEPSYRSDIEAQQQGEKEIEALNGMRDALLDLVSFLSNPDNLTPRY